MYLGNKVTIYIKRKILCDLKKTIMGNINYMEQKEIHLQKVHNNYKEIYFHQGFVGSW